MPQKIRTALIGLGRLGKRYAEMLRAQLPAAELVAACSIVPEEREYARAQLGLEAVFSDSGEMLRSIAPEALFVVSSTDQHAAHIVQGLEAGCHVFCEKPLSVNVAECLRVEAIAAQHPGHAHIRPSVRQSHLLLLFRQDKSTARARRAAARGVSRRPCNSYEHCSTAPARAFKVLISRDSDVIFFPREVRDHDVPRGLRRIGVAQ